jgi:hypothetical protein
MKRPFGWRDHCVANPDERASAPPFGAGMQTRLNLQQPGAALAVQDLEVPPW